MMRRKRNRQIRDEITAALENPSNSHEPLSALACLVDTDLKINSTGPFSHQGRSNNREMVIQDDRKQLLDRLLDIALLGKQDNAFEIIPYIERVLLANNITSTRNCDNKCNSTIELRKKDSFSLFRFLSISHSSKDASRDERIFEVATLFISTYPEMKYHISSTGNTLLHLALQNNGNSEKLIKLLLDTTTNSKSKDILTKKNKCGKIPLHTAICAGVPIHILKVIIDASILAFSGFGKEIPFRLADRGSNILEVEDDKGMNAIELAWVRRLHPGSHHFDGIWTSQNALRKKQMYQSLFHDAVEQIEIVCNEGHTSNEKYKQSNGTAKHTVADEMLGSFWSTTLLLLRGAYYGTLTDTLLYAKGTKWCMVHAASALSSCPLEILKITIVLHPEQAREKDENGLMPLHLAIQQYQSDSNSRNPSNPKSSWIVYYKKIELLIDSYPEAAKVCNEKGELPLQMVLKLPNCNTFELSLWENIVKKLISAHPDAIHMKDVKSNLYSYMQAAIAIPFNYEYTNYCNENSGKNSSIVSLDIIYILLRMTPSLIQLSL